ncbi:MAG: aldo/keto reductase [Thermoguttaceae bacterium]|jgi:aryl-alcohol dehydrogenase-like predicted oxidoreductase|nr:aldo/keto reductase [Thermoguttaceae bacterium]
MHTINRRDFLAGLGAAAATMAGGLGFAAEDRPAVKRGNDLVALGRTGIKTTILGMGTGTVGGSQQLALGQEGFTRLVRHGLERGLRYIDTADAYHMHLFVRLALQGVPRDRYFLQTKTTARHPEVAKADIERFRRELRVETLDTVLMHCMTTGSWPTDMRPVMDVLDEAKRRGRVRAVGISCHGLEPLAASVACDWVDVQLVRINPFGAKMDGKPEEVAPLVQQMHAKGRGVLGMKIFGEDGLGSREKRLQSLKYVLGLGCVDAFTIGFRSIQELDETLELIELATKA